MPPRWVDKDKAGGEKILLCRIISDVQFAVCLMYNLFDVQTVCLMYNSILCLLSSQFPLVSEDLFPSKWA